jgi:hypothetical protein
VAIPSSSADFIINTPGWLKWQRQPENQHANHPRKPDQSAPNNSRVAPLAALDVARPLPTTRGEVVDRPKTYRTASGTSMPRWLLGLISFLTLLARGYRPSKATASFESAADLFFAQTPFLSKIGDKTSG